MNKEEKIKNIINKIREPELPEKFWESFKLETLRKDREKKEKISRKKSIWVSIRKPVFAVVTLIVIISSVVLYFSKIKMEKQYYTESVDFYFDEFDSILSQNLLVSENVIIIEENNNN